MCFYVHVVCVCVPNIRNKMGESLLKDRLAFQFCFRFQLSYSLIMYLCIE